MTFVGDEADVEFVSGVDGSDEGVAGGASANASLKLVLSFGGADVTGVLVVADR